MNIMQEGTEIHLANQVIVLNPIQEMACEILNSIHLYELRDIHVKQLEMKDELASENSHLVLRSWTPIGWGSALSPSSCEIRAVQLTFTTRRAGVKVVVDFWLVGLKLEVSVRPGLVPQYAHPPHSSLVPIGLQLYWGTFGRWGEKKSIDDYSMGDWGWLMGEHRCVIGCQQRRCRVSRILVSRD